MDLLPCQTEKSLASPTGLLNQRFPKIRRRAIMPIVQIDMLEGRSTEQKRELAKKITEVIVETAKCQPDAVTIVIREAAKQHISKAGVLMLDK
ncbi:2-hydroxymuconate tautomerase [Propionispora hippei]|uniref:2-hydroxymuconate tautomerase n=1 Tax=Propionispora hippei TaxID=209080 RepID=UPI00122C8620|nr:2-hydroxymuconate tautomerase [Propionispora hippei]